jgi:three-Cys-motif partner protein
MSEPASTLWPLDPHTRGKHLVLQNYLGAWFPILGSSTTRVLFIDGFAGPGVYAGGEPGSPMIALHTYIDHRHRHLVTAEAVFVFIEKDAARAAHLKTMLDELQPTLPPQCKAYVETGLFDDHMTRVLDALQAAGRQLAPAFVMVDPFGVSGTPMSVVRKILANPKAEVYVSFMYEAINRFKTTAEFGPHLDSLFGCTEWRAGMDIADSTERKEFFHSLYERQLKDAGATQVVRFELHEGDRLVYAIFFGTKSTTGSDRMKQAIWKVAPFGDFRFRGVRSGQLGLELASADFKPLIDALTAEFGGQGWVKVSDIQRFVASDRTDFHTGHVKKQALKPLEQAGRIEVDPMTRSRRFTYPDGVLLRFI